MPLTSDERSTLSLLIANTIHSLYAGHHSDYSVSNFIRNTEAMFWHGLYTGQEVEIDGMSYENRTFIRKILKEELKKLKVKNIAFKEKLKNKLDQGPQEFEAGVLALLAKALSLDAEHYRENLPLFYNSLMRNGIRKIFERNAFYFQLNPTETNKEMYANFVKRLEIIFETQEERAVEKKDIHDFFHFLVVLLLAIDLFFLGFVESMSVNLGWSMVGEVNSFLHTLIAIVMCLIYILNVFWFSYPSYKDLKQFKSKKLLLPPNINSLHQSRFVNHKAISTLKEQINQLASLIEEVFDTVNVFDTEVKATTKAISTPTSFPQIYELPDQGSARVRRAAVLPAIQPTPPVLDRPANLLISPRDQVVFYLGLRAIIIPPLSVGARNLDDLSSGLPDGVSKIQSTDGAYLYGYIYIKPFAEITWYGKADQGLYDEFKRLAAMGSIVSVGAGNYNVGTGIKRMTSGQYEIVNKHAHYANFRMFSNTEAVHADAPYDRYYMIVFDTVGQGLAHT